MKFRPLHNRVVVRRVEEDPKTKGGVRRQIIWDFWRRDRMEDLAHLLIDVMRPGRGVASVGSGWSVV